MMTGLRIEFIGLRKMCPNESPGGETEGNAVDFY